MKKILIIMALLATVSNASHQTVNKAGAKAESAIVSEYQRFSLTPSAWSGEDESFTRYKALIKKVKYAIRVLNKHHGAKYKTALKALQAKKYTKATFHGDELIHVGIVLSKAHGGIKNDLEWHALKMSDWYNREQRRRKAFNNIYNGVTPFKVHKGWLLGNKNNCYEAKIYATINKGRYLRLYMDYCSKEFAFTITPSDIRPRTYEEMFTPYKDLSSLHYFYN